MKDSSIQWTDNSFNPWEGCTKVAPECKNCYAEVLVDHRFGRAKWGAGQPRRRTSENLWKQPLKWNASVVCPTCGELDADFRTKCLTCDVEMRRQRVFCLSLGDWLDEEVPIEWLADLLALIRATQNLDWQLLTKRPQNWRARIEVAQDYLFDLGDRNVAGWLSDWRKNGIPPSNVWIGVSAGADQRAALDIPARIHFLSCEPMLKPLDSHHLPTKEFDWIILGGESGPHARPCHLEWFYQGLEFCERNGIAPFVKQVGANCWDDRHDCQLRLKDSHGGHMAEWPEELRVREFPQSPS